MSSLQDPEKLGIAPDEEWRNMIEQNAQDAWRKYCEINGLDPNAQGDEVIAPEDCPF